VLTDKIDLIIASHEAEDHEKIMGLQSAENE
jgi:hypothetical protein